MSMVNLLKETQDILGQIEKTPEDIAFIGSIHPHYSCSWDEFCSLANFEYDRSYGSQKVASDLVIIFKDKTWMSRGEYDGSEWWSYHAIKKPRGKGLPIRVLAHPLGYGWNTVNELNK